MGSVLNGGHDRRVFGVTGENKNAKLRRNGQKPSTGFRDGGIGEFDVKQHHVRGVSLDDRHAFRDGPRLTDDRHIRLEVEQRSKSSTDHLMIIDKNDAGLRLFHTGVNTGSNENSAVTCVPPPALD